jgi:exopolyphosphatase/guanosine-5'-triphosphate,3'-diphosphate pyrophosphatase
MDVGGGSTELILGKHASQRFAESFPLGTVRLLQRLQPGDPPGPDQLTACRTWLARFLELELSSTIKPALDKVRDARSPEQAVQLVGTGGTASILACMEAKLSAFDRERLEATRLSRDRLRWHVDHLWSLPASERERIVGLPPNRADVILTGVAIFEAVMDYFDFQQLRVSTRGLRFAIVMEQG